MSFVQLTNPYLLFTTLPVSKNCFNCEWVLLNWKVTEKITIFLIHPPICVSATLSLKHFFCRCPLFSIPRLILVDTVSNILSQKNIHLTNLNMKDLVKIYLYGDSRFKACENRLILLATIKSFCKAGLTIFYAYVHFLSVFLS